MRCCWDGWCTDRAYRRLTLRTIEQGDERRPGVALPAVCRVDGVPELHHARGVWLAVVAGPTNRQLPTDVDDDAGDPSLGGRVCGKLPAPRRHTPLDSGATKYGDNGTAAAQLAASRSPTARAWITFGASSTSRTDFTCGEGWC